MGCRDRQCHTCCSVGLGEEVKFDLFENVVIFDVGYEVDAVAHLLRS